MLQDLGAALAFPVPHDRARPPSVLPKSFAPDLRLAALLPRPSPCRWWRRCAARRWRSLAATGACSRSFAPPRVLWLATSANARYGLVVLLLAGVCLARIAERLLPLAGGARRARPAARGAARHHHGGFADALVPRRAVVPALAAVRRARARAARARAVPHARDPADGGGRAVRPSRLLVRQLSRPAQPAARFAAARRAARAPSRQGARARPRAGAGRGPAARRAGQRPTTTRCVRIGYRVDAATASPSPGGATTMTRCRARPTGSPDRCRRSEPLSVVSCALRPAPRDPGDVEKREARVRRCSTASRRRCRAAVSRPDRGHRAAGRRLVALLLGARCAAGGVRRPRDAPPLPLRDHFDLGRLSDWEREGAARPAACGAQRAD